MTNLTRRTLMKAAAERPRPLELHVTEGLGHHRLLADPGVIRRTLDFMHGPA